MTTIDALAPFAPHRRRPRRNADETDAFGPGRYALACLVNHPAAVTKTKARANRRERRETRHALRTYA